VRKSPIGKQSVTFKIEKHLIYLNQNAMKILTLIIIIAGASYVYYEQPDAPVKKAGTCKNMSRKATCANKEFADQKDN
jgi:hypothetical protein